MTNLITKTLISETKRLDFLPRHTGKHFTLFETLVYGYMDQFCADYIGGYWEFYDLSNGGFFMALDDTDTAFEVTNPLNYFDGSLSAEAVSIGVNLFALCHLCEITGDENFAHAYHALRDFACEHKDAGAILSFID